MRIAICPPATRVYCRCELSIEKWDERYRSGERGGSEPSRIVVEGAALIKPGRALDLAAGAGRNAIYLKQNGWKVTAVDGSEEAIKLVRAQKIEGRVLDLEQSALPFADEWFDLVCIVNFLHRPLFAEARRVCRRGGIIAAEIPTTSSKKNFSLPPGDLRSMFGDWELLVDREGDVAEIVARNPTA